MDPRSPLRQSRPLPTSHHRPFGSQVHLLIAASKDLKDKIHCGQLIKSIAPIVDGSGGGRPDRAQAGGKNIDKIDEALEKVKTLV